ncbi:NAD-dependent protein deacylase [Pseudomonas sp. CFBP 13711]|uniref:SIR2 family NAD-dependent protein deacylase n=1 Tax=unclassified Pseudomonas TaxID=196821 RepID=UPI001783D595|nr:MULTISPECIES: NAD-dependent protein deacylase [unclassified Pseudomonas]MBD8708460.1 NAD-dependent protein deacylase [Pseudomonas sp. CFBP 13711]MBD8713902.1 NAD-dependent protein deacylase [Pseudomonas sp. CFBP 13715]
MPDADRAVAALKAAKNIVFFTGAGISAESGIPTFRDKLTRVWSTHDPEKLETAKAFRENPALVWGFYLWRRNQMSQAKPNAAHLAIQRLASTDRTVAMITQNIDDLHERAGSADVAHLLGSLITPKCFACGRSAELQVCQYDFQHAVEHDPPRCPRCNGRLRPSITWFGEDLSPAVWKSAVKTSESCDVLVSVGTSGVGTPAAEIPHIALSSGAVVIHVNLVNVSIGTANKLMIVGKASEALPALLSAACGI